MGKIMLNATANSKIISKTFQEFQQFNRMKNLSEDTTDNYEQTYEVFAKHYDCEKPCMTLDLGVIFSFISYLRDERKVCDVTVNTHLSNIRVFINYCR